MLIMQIHLYNIERNYTLLANIPTEVSGDKALDAYRGFCVYKKSAVHIHMIMVVQSYSIAKVLANIEKP